MAAEVMGGLQEHNRTNIYSSASGIEFAFVAVGSLLGTDCRAFRAPRTSTVTQGRN